MRSIDSGMQLHALGGFTAEYEVTVPIEGKYLLSARVATVQTGQKLLVSRKGDAQPQGLHPKGGEMRKGNDLAVSPADGIVPLVWIDVFSNKPEYEPSHAMKQTFAITTLLLVCASAAFAGFTERKLESAMKRASASDKKIAFVFYQDYYLPNCPTCVRTVNANNSAIKKAVPRSEVVIIEIEKGDKDMDKLPSAVSAQGSLPRIVVTDAACEKLVAKLDGAPDREKAKAFEEEVKSAE